MPIATSTCGLDRIPASIIFLEPINSSSAGWNINLTLPWRSLRCSKVSVPHREALLCVGHVRSYVRHLFHYETEIIGFLHWQSVHVRPQEHCLSRVCTFDTCGNPDGHISLAPVQFHADGSLHMKLFPADALRLQRVCAGNVGLPASVLQAVFALSKKWFMHIPP